MKLSEAIREGAKLHPYTPLVWAFFEYSSFEMVGQGKASKIIATDALGAAWEGLFGKVETSLHTPPNEEVEDIISKETGADLQQKITNPSDLRNEPLSDILVDLHEKQWTREQIADWLESVGY